MNTDHFIKRLETVLEYYNLSASAFADKIGVQRSGLSHLLSGRNKPSLDFVLKITEHFPEVNLYWILNGKGTFPTNESETIPAPVPERKLQDKEPGLPLPIPESNHSAIHKIIVFYNDGTFAEYNPRP